MPIHLVIFKEIEVTLHIPKEFQYFAGPNYLVGKITWPKIYLTSYLSLSSPLKSIASMGFRVHWTRPYIFEELKSICIHARVLHLDYQNKAFYNKSYNTKNYLLSWAYSVTVMMCLKIEVLTIYLYRKLPECARKLYKFFQCDSFKSS